MRLRQLFVLMQELERLKVFQRDDDGRVRVCEMVWLVGDFNSTPDSICILALKGLATSNEEDEGICSCVRDIQAYPRWTSVMEVSNGCEPDFTNYTRGFKGTLDYLFFLRPDLDLDLVESLESMSLLGRDGFEAMSMPPSSELEPGLPNSVHPSDHLPLLVQWNDVS
jgi:CCR4-NOT transcription complex subunit 6